MKNCLPLPLRNNRLHKPEMAQPYAMTIKRFGYHEI